MIEIHLQTRLEEGKDVEVAQVIDITEETDKREIIVICQELRNILKYLEESLYEEWKEDLINE